MNPEPTQHDLDAMETAIELAKQAASMGEVPVGAVVYRTETGETIAKAHNRRETDDDPTAHAEILAIRDAATKIGDWRLNECTLVVTLEPCVMCAGAIVNARVGRLVFGATDPKAGAVGSLYEIPADTRLNHRPPVIRGLMAETSGELLREFFRERRSKPSK